DGFSVDHFWSRPTLRAAQDHHRPHGPIQIPATASVVLTSGVLNRSNFAHDHVQSSGHELMHGFGLVSFDEIRLPAIASEEMSKFLIAHSREQRRIRDLVAVEVENRQHGAVPDRVQKLIAMPTGG